MGMEPRTPRIDALAAIYRALRDTVAGHRITTELEAGDDASGDPLTVVQVNVVPAGPYTRSAFNVDVTLMTFATTTTAALPAHVEAADAMLELTEVTDDNGVAGLVSAVVSTLEPSEVPGRSAPQWPGQLSRYNLYLRTWR